MARVFLSLGSNRGNRAENMRRMVDALSDLLSLPLARSHLMETEPLGMDDTSDPFYNLVVSGGFEGTPYDILECCEQIERALGRENKGMLLARTADIDVLLYDEVRVMSSRLEIPHPELTNRMFCVEGIAQIDPSTRIPLSTGMQSISEIKRTLPEPVRHQRIEIVPWQCPRVPLGRGAAKEERSES